MLIKFQGKNTNQKYPYIILTFLYVIGVVCGIFAPETLHKKLPDSLEEARKFGAGQVKNVFCYYKKSN